VLSIQAVRGLPRLRARGTVPCVISPSAGGGEHNKPVAARVLSLGLLSESMPLAETPLAGVRVAARPQIRPARLVAAHPGALVEALLRRTAADAVPVGLAGRPAAAVRAAVVERVPPAHLKPLVTPRRSRRWLLLLLMMMMMMLGGQCVRLHCHRRPSETHRLQAAWR